MVITQTGWSITEVKIAESVLQRAYETEINALMNHIRQTINHIESVEQLWQLHDLLSTKRYTLDGKYDNRESMLVFTFAGLIKEKLISIDDLEGLAPEKLAKIASLARL